MVSPTAAAFYSYKSFWSVLRSQALETSPEPCWTWPGSAPKPPRLSPEPSPETCWTWPGFAPKPLRNLLRNLLQNPVESGLALRQVELDGSAPKPPTFSATFFGTLLNLTWLCTKASQDLLRNLFRNPVEPDLALHQSLPDLLWVRNPVEPDLALHQSLPDLLWNLRNLLRNFVEPDPAPAPVHTGAILGWGPH